MAYGDEQSMRILPSWSTVMKEKVGSTPRVDDLEVQPVALGDRLPEGHAGAAHRIDADLEAGGGDGVHVDDVAPDRRRRA